MNPQYPGSQGVAGFGMAGNQPNAFQMGQAGYQQQNFEPGFSRMPGGQNFGNPGMGMQPPHQQQQQFYGQQQQQQQSMYVQGHMYNAQQQQHRQYQQQPQQQHGQMYQQQQQQHGQIYQQQLLEQQKQQQQFFMQQQKQQQALAEAQRRQEEERRRQAEEQEKQRKFHEQREKLRLMGTGKSGVNLDQFYSKSSSFLSSSGSKSSPQMQPSQSHPKPSQVEKVPKEEVARKPVDYSQFANVFAAVEETPSPQDDFGGFQQQPTVTQQGSDDFGGFQQQSAATSQGPNNFGVFQQQPAATQQGPSDFGGFQQQPAATQPGKNDFGGFQQQPAASVQGQASWQSDWQTTPMSGGAASQSVFGTTPSHLTQPSGQGAQPLQPFGQTSQPQQPSGQVLQPLQPSSEAAPALKLSSGEQNVLQPSDPISSATLQPMSNNVVGQQGAPIGSSDADEVQYFAHVDSLPMQSAPAAPMPTVLASQLMSSEPLVAAPSPTTAMQGNSNMTSASETSQLSWSAQSTAVSPGGKKSVLPVWCRELHLAPSLYQQVFLKCCDKKQQWVDTHLVYPILSASGLPRGQLKEIWDMSSRMQKGKLNRIELYVALGLIALAQLGEQKLSIGILADRMDPPVPVLHNVDLPNLPAHLRAQPRSLSSVETEVKPSMEGFTPASSVSMTLAASAAPTSAGLSWSSALVETASLTSAAPAASVGGGSSKTTLAALAQFAQGVSKAEKSTSEQVGGGNSTASNVALSFSNTLTAPTSTSSSVPNSGDKYSVFASIDSSQAQASENSSGAFSTFASVQSSSEPSVESADKFPVFSSTTQSAAQAGADSSDKYSAFASFQSSSQPSSSADKYSAFSAMEPVASTSSAAMSNGLSGMSVLAPNTSEAVTLASSGISTTAVADDKYSAFSSINTTSSHEMYSGFESSSGLSAGHVVGDKPTTPNDRYGAFSMADQQDQDLFAAAPATVGSATAALSTSSGVPMERNSQAMLPGDTQFASFGQALESDISSGHLNAFAKGQNNISAAGQTQTGLVFGSNEQTGGSESFGDFSSFGSTPIPAPPAVAAPLTGEHSAEENTCEHSAKITGDDSFGDFASFESAPMPAASVPAGVSPALPVKRIAAEKIEDKFAALTGFNLGGSDGQASSSHRVQHVALPSTSSNAEFATFDNAKKAAGEKKSVGAPSMRVVGNYSVFSSVIEMDHDKQWGRCLQAFQQLLNTAVTTLDSLPTDDGLRVLINAKQGSDYLTAVIEIYRVFLRVIASASDAVVLPEAAVNGVTTTWKRIANRLKSTSMEPKAEEVDVQFLRQSGTCNDINRACGVCLLDVGTGDAGSSMPQTADVTSLFAKTSNTFRANIARIQLGQRWYHATCANFWCNCVESNLPSLPLLTELL